MRRLRTAVVPVVVCLVAGCADSTPAAAPTVSEVGRPVAIGAVVQAGEVRGSAGGGGGGGGSGGVASGAQAGSALAQLESGDESARATALRTLLRGADPRSDPGVVTAVVKRMREDPSARVRVLAIHVLASWREGAADAVPSLMQLLESRTYRGHAMDALSRMGPPGRAAIPRLIEMTRDREASVRQGAVLALSAFGSAAAAALPSLIERLAEDESDAVRAAAAESLGRLGAAAEPALDALRAAAAADQGGRVRGACQTAIRAISGG